MKSSAKEKTFQFKSNPLIAASLYSAASAIIKISTTLVVGKIIALKTGAEGIAIYGQILNFVVIMLVVSGGAINEGITKLVSEYRILKSDNLSKLLSTSLKYTVLCSILVAVLLIIFSSQLSTFVLQGEEYDYVFVLFGFTIIFYNINNMLLAILNGFKQYKNFNFISICSNFLNLFLTLVLVVLYNLKGALIAVVLNQAIVLFLSLFFLRKQLWLTVANFSKNFDNGSFKLLFSFALLSILSTAANPVVSILIRNAIVDTISLKSAGYYEFASRISSTSILFFSLTVTSYYLPRISEIRKKNELFTEIKNTYKIIAPVVFLLLSLIYISRHLIIEVLATIDFYESERLFFFQLLGVFFKICAQVLGFVFLAKAKIKILISIELILNIIYVLLSIFLIKKLGIIGTSYAFAVYNFIYLIVVTLIFYGLFINNKSEKC